MKYVCAFAIIGPAKGIYERFPYSREEAQKWLRDGNVISVIWHPDPSITAAISETFGIAAVDRPPEIRLNKGDEALLIGFIPPPDWYHIPPPDGPLPKWSWSHDFVSEHCEFELKKRVL